MKKDFNRRQFIGTLGMGTVGALAFNACSTSKGPDTILYNANIFTSNPAQPKAQAIAYTNGRIVAVGSNDDILNLTGSSTTKIDCLLSFFDIHSTF